MVFVKTCWVDPVSGRVHLLLCLPGGEDLDLIVDKSSHPVEGNFSFARRILTAVLESLQTDLPLSLPSRN